MSPFAAFGPSHLVALALSLAVPAALAKVARAKPAWDPLIRYAFAVLLSGIWVGWYVVAVLRGWLTWGNVLPMNLCDWAAFVLIAALIHPSQKMYDLSYFWALGGTMQALVTPDVPYDFPEARFVIFFISHGGILAAVLYLTFGTRLRPHPQSLVRVIVWSFVYLLAAAVVDAALGTNYGFLRAPPVQDTIFNFLSPWPAYIPELVALGFLSAVLYYAPWFLYDRWKSSPQDLQPPLPEGA